MKRILSLTVILSLLFLTSCQNVPTSIPEQPVSKEKPEQPVSKYGWRYLKFGMDKETVERLLKENGELGEGFYKEKYHSWIPEVHLYKYGSDPSGSSIDFNSSRFNDEEINSTCLHTEDTDDNILSHTTCFKDNKFYARKIEIEAKPEETEAYHEKIKEKYPNGKEVISSTPENMFFETIRVFYKFISDDRKFGLLFYSYLDTQSLTSQITLLYYDNEVLEEILNNIEKKELNESKQKLDKIKQEKIKEKERLQYNLNNL